VISVMFPVQIASYSFRSEPGRDARLTPAFDRE
jgi:hypothetical protein